MSVNRRLSVLLTRVHHFFLACGSELRSDITGKVVRYLQEDGAEINAGEPYIEVRRLMTRRI